MLLPCQRTQPVFSPGFTGQRAQIISHDHAPHLDCSDCQVVQVAVKNMLVLRWSQRHIVSFVADPKGTLEPPKGTVPFGKSLARTLDATPPNFVEKTFANSHKTMKFAKVFSLKSFPLYGSTRGCTLYFCKISTWYMSIRAVWVQC